MVIRAVAARRPQRIASPRQRLGRFAEVHVTPPAVLLLGVRLASLDRVHGPTLRQNGSLSGFGVAMVFRRHSTHPAGNLRERIVGWKFSDVVIADDVHFLSVMLQQRPEFLKAGSAL